MDLVVGAQGSQTSRWVKRSVLVFQSQPSKHDDGHECAHVRENRNGMAMDGNRLVRH